MWARVTGSHSKSSLNARIGLQQGIRKLTVLYQISAACKCRLCYNPVRVSSSPQNRIGIAVDASASKFPIHSIEDRSRCPTITRSGVCRPPLRWPECLVLEAYHSLTTVQGNRPEYFERQTPGLCAEYYVASSEVQGW